MTGPLDGIRVVELGIWVAAPSAAAMLADWGAEVVKIEGPGGDPFRNFLGAYRSDVVVDAPFETDNRGKRSIAVDLAGERGREVLDRILVDADVFVTNLRPAALERLGLDWPSIHGRHPRLVHATVTGYGGSGDLADRAAYDFGAFWARTGMAAALGHPDGTLPFQRPGIGDHTAGLAIAGGVAAALLARDRTGVGQQVTTSLFRAGTFLLGLDLNMHLRAGLPAGSTDPRSAPNPLSTCYRTADGSWLWLLGVEPTRHWPGLLNALDLGHLEHDPRFATTSDRFANNRELIALLDGTFATRTRADWAEVLDRHGVWWEPVHGITDVVADPAARASGALVDDEHGAPHPVASPVDFGSYGRSAPRPYPELGADTAAILAECGFDGAEIGALQAAGIVGAATAVGR